MQTGSPEAGHAPELTRRRALGGVGVERAEVLMAPGIRPSDRAVAAGVSGGVRVEVLSAPALHGGQDEDPGAVRRASPGVGWQVSCRRCMCALTSDPSRPSAV